MNKTYSLKLIGNFALILLALAILFGCHKEKLPVVKIQTRLGSIFIKVDTIKAPVTAKNFLKLVEMGIYNKATFYRVVRTDNQPGSPVKIEVIQGGLFDDAVIEKYPTIRHETTSETGVIHTDGVISMARYTPGTASTEFFICIGNQPGLDYNGGRNPDKQGFAAFGNVVKGMDVVKKIQQLPDSNQYLLEHLPILKAEVVR